MSPVIQVENISKQYIIGHRRQATQVSLRETLAQGGRNLARRLLHPFLSSSGQPLIGEKDSEEFWALKNISFEVNQGERVGIIGCNGAGKSTLLKILSRITEPTTGRMRLKGRVASLLEVGTGFHPELSGRENVFLNGTILGMSKSEIKTKFDAIVAFAEIERFLDTPVKRYSSGMYVRLAFAVAAHLEPEILVVDEVLAVGDVAFQKKCLGKMKDVAGEGRTVLFVSHNMGAISQFCSKAILLQNGQIDLIGRPDEAVKKYLDSNLSASGAMVVKAEVPPDEDCAMQIIQLSLNANQPGSAGVFDVFDEISLEVEYEVRKPLSGYSIYCEFIRNGEVLFVTFDTSESAELLGERSPGRYRTCFDVPCPLLKPGEYEVSLMVGQVRTPPIQTVEKALRFGVELMSRSDRYASYAEARPGVVAVAQKWRTEQILKA